MESKDIKELKRLNLIRIIEQFKLQQNQLAVMIDQTPEYLNKLVKGHRGISDDIIAKICSVLDISPYEFYINHTTPLPATDLARKALNMVREAEKTQVEHIASEAIEFARHRIETVKKQKKEGTRKGQPARHKAGSG
jgi:plasmid maintenance system antidote protein VapI